MTTSPLPWWERPLARTAAVLALLAYLPALAAAPGRMPSDSKLYLYLDPGRFVVDAASTFDPRQFAGWVPHQHVAYLWPGAPWFWTFDALGVPDWIAHRLWIGTIMVAAGLGVRWCARQLGLTPMAAFVAAVVYQLSLYVLPYVSRTSVMLLPWAGLGWIMAFTIRATRRRTWGDPAAVALVVLTVGAVNATALAMIVPAPVLWLVHSAWSRAVTWRDASVVGLKIAASSLAVSSWWIAMLVIQGRHGTDVLPYSEALADVSLTATSGEVWRSLGYWLFYVRDPAAPATSESLRYLSSTPTIAVSYLLPLAALAGLALVRWNHRRFAALLIGVGLVLAVGVHPEEDRSPLMRLLTGDADGGIALALRSSTRALPVMALGIALALAMTVQAAADLRPLRTIRADWLVAGAVSMVAVVNLPALWTGGFVDPALDRDQDPPAAWLDAAAALDADGDDARVLQVPGVEFGAYRWGYTVDQPLPGLTDKPLVTRDLLPLGSAAAMDLLYALDDRIQDGVLEPEAVAPVAQLLGVDTVWLTNDVAFDRFRTARPEVARDVIVGAPGISGVEAFGPPFVNRPEVPMSDERAVGDPRVGAPVAPVELASLDDPVAVVRSNSATVVVSGSGDGLVDAAAAAFVDPSVATVRYSASTGDPAAVMADAVGLVVTDSNRDRARHWRSSQDTTGFTESGGEQQAVLRPVASDARLPVFETTDPATQTIAEQRGPVVAAATSYGEPFAYLPEHRPVMAVDGDPTTAWLVGEHGEPVGETIRLEYAGRATELRLRQPDTADGRRITRVVVTEADPSLSITERTIDLDERSWTGTGQTVPIESGADSGAVDITIDAVGGGTPFTASAVSAVGFAELDLGLGSTVEVIRPPHDALAVVDPSTPLAITLTRLRVDPMDRWRDDPEPELVREFEIPSARDMALAFDVRVDARAPDSELATLFGWPVVASSRLTGSIRHAGVAAFDGDGETAWITAFGEADGATITARAEQPVSRVSVRQPVTGFSRIERITVRSGGEERSVDLRPDAAGTALAMIDPPLPAGVVEFELSEVSEITTIDRRFGDRVALPAAISELVVDGGAVAEPLRTASWSAPCTTVASIDGQALSARLGLSGDAWLDGAALDVEPCDEALDLSAGSHLVRSDVGDLPITLDRIVLDDGVGAALSGLGPGSTATVVDRGRFDRRVEVRGCTDGCWLIVGEGFNTAWAAEGPDGDLGEPTLVDGGFNGWWIPPATVPIVIDVRWTAQRGLDVALLLSGLAALAAVALVVRDRRRPSDDSSVPPASPALLTTTTSTTETGSTTSRARTAATWVVLSAALVGPSWMVWGAVAAAAVLATRRRRLAEWTALASLLVVAAGVVVRERRSAPLPNGGWPGTFESLHQLGMFAVVAVLVGALVADDAATAPAATTNEATDER